ncbi:glycosyltransferase family 4 protein, partial [bacterium]|nr:glycosyltransferase family 4 protein [bacterium]
MPTELHTLRVAIVHDWLVSMRGGEKVLEALLELFPQAELFTLFHKEGSVSRAIEKRTIHTSFLNRLPGVSRYYRQLLPLLPIAAEKLDVSRFDLVLSSSHCVAKGVIPNPDALHLCYCYTTMRYAWDQSSSYFRSRLSRALAAPFLHYLRVWDVASSSRVDHFVADSHFVARRIRKYYRREADVIHPFADLERFPKISGERGEYYLVVGALAPYKRVELAV